MNTKIPVLTDNQTLEEVISLREENVSLETQEECNRRTIFEILIRVVTTGDSLENTCYN
jgi:hypothetical protein